MARRLENARKEVEEVRSRLLLKRWDTMSFDVQWRLLKLAELIGTSAGNELHRHVVVGSIAALQTFHRGTVVSIVDSGEEYRARAAESITEKISMKDALSWLSGETMTFGELVSHTIACNSVSDLMYWLGTLLACDMKKTLADAIDPYDRRSGKENPTRVVADVDRLLSSLAEAFRLRHIFVHEAADSIEVNEGECRALHSAVTQWTKGIHAVLWATVYEHLPLFQYEMNQHSAVKILEARKRLATAMRRALLAARAVGSASWLRRNHFAWMKATKDWTNGSYGSLQGTMWPSVANSDLARAIQTRADQVIGWNHSQNPEDPAE